MKIINVVGARPNFMKIAPIIREMQKYPQMETLLVHTGQHYDIEMSEAFFDDLGIPEPDINLEVGSGSHAEQTAHVMLKFEKVLLQEKPDLVLVVGDINSTIACTLTAVKLGIKVAHVEAGLRSLDRTMPEEINRILTDAISDFLFTTCRDANENLLREGISPEKTFFVGNVMIDTLMRNKEKAERSDILNRLEMDDTDYALLTLHRPSNVDNCENFGKILDALDTIRKQIKIIYPVHPRTRKRIREFSLEEKVEAMPGLKLIKPLSYRDFLKLMLKAKLVMTDSGGMQEETTALGIPCLTLRENTERPITVNEGTNYLVGRDKNKILKYVDDILTNKGKRGKTPELWDGRTAERIIKIIAKNI
ncbi:MAG: UDP-N-acetylglucosamine 2-epimerase (non-hydrolyzing) [Nitrospirae bacterium]|nr:UDP-N-acetylglucosamine 2-epimerase (non-hydrolyzing) [Nitrospirota bacterium]